jgi:hypothetical protein
MVRAVSVARAQPSEVGEFLFLRRPARGDRCLVHERQLERVATFAVGLRSRYAALRDEREVQTARRHESGTRLSTVDGTSYFPSYGPRAKRQRPKAQSCSKRPSPKRLVFDHD